MLKEFQFEIYDKKNSKNIVAYHLSRLIMESSDDLVPIRDSFPDEQLMSVSKFPWFANIVNYLVTSQMPTYWTKQDVIIFN